MTLLLDIGLLTPISSVITLGMNRLVRTALNQCFKLEAIILFNLPRRLDELYHDLWNALKL